MNLINQETEWKKGCLHMSLGGLINHIGINDFLFDLHSNHTSNISSPWRGILNFTQCIHYDIALEIAISSIQQACLIAGCKQTAIVVTEEQLPLILGAKEISDNPHNKIRVFLDAEQASNWLIFEHAKERRKKLH